MIEGLKVTIVGEELAQLCMCRADYHRERSEKYTQQIEAMKKDRIEGMNYTNGDPIKSLEDRRATHDSEYGELVFIADHIEKSETYLLGREDLVKLGITKSRY